MARQAAEDLLSSLLPPARRAQPRRADSHLFRQPSQHAPSPSTALLSPSARPVSDYGTRQHATADFTEDDEHDDDNDDDDDDDGDVVDINDMDDDDEDEEEEEDDDDDDGQDDAHDDDDGPSMMARLRQLRRNHTNRPRADPNTMLPLFSASHLDSLPVYSLVHAIRVIVQTRTETSLTWDQLRSPQVSQFLLRPMQQQIRTQHFNRATLYALIANCLQFAKEGQLFPGNAGTSGTRAKVCELLALKLLKEYNTRELIDALSYDFYPLQGIPEPAGSQARSLESRGKAAAARSSTLEIAILAQTKHFLAHPLVVQQLEAIWNGAISFYSSQDRLHRESPADDARTETLGLSGPDAKSNNNARTPLLRFKPASTHGKEQLPMHSVPIKRTVALYDPRHASPMKLSRLRVPRYRQFVSTCSLFVLICLFIAVLAERSTSITTLELVFWFWSAGFMLDEVVGFNEQGFSLYIMSFWNIFDLGILFLLVIYYCMRVCGVFLLQPAEWNDMAYDVLAANAILLLPRIFSILDHYQYFSQLLIAFRLMAADLVAVFVLIAIACSGFFVFFTLSKNQNDASTVAYQIFQIVVGFTPAAWDVWDDHTWLGRFLLALLLILCHFIVVTILITVLTNSFMSIARNAEEEHQFLFAINTISMVKNDALFSYMAPGNIFAWALTPLRFIMPIKQFVIMNRFVIKVTHFPLLFCIFLYEKYFLASSIYEPTDLVDHSTRRSGKLGVSLHDPMSAAGLFSPHMRTREDSMAGLQKDRALDEVFRRPPETMRNQRRQERRKTQSAIRNWIDQNDSNLGVPLSHWPTLDSYPTQSVRRLSMSREVPSKLRHISDVRSTASDPAELMSNSGFPGTNSREVHRQVKEQQVKAQTDADADGDDELVTNDEDDGDDNAIESQRDAMSQAGGNTGFTTPNATLRGALISSSVDSVRFAPGPSPKAGNAPRRGPAHNRTLSTNTILYAPQQRSLSSSPSTVANEPPGQRSRPRTSRLTPGEPSVPAGARSPRKPQNAPAPPPTRPRLIASKTAPNRAALIPAGAKVPRARRLPSVDVDLNSEIRMDLQSEFDAVPASFTTQMAMATGQLKGPGRNVPDESADRMSRLVLARMKTLEESFGDVLKEVRYIRSNVPTSANSGDDGSWRDSNTPADLSSSQHAEKRRSWAAPSTSTPTGGAPRPRERADRAERSLPSSVRDERNYLVSPPKRKAREKGKGRVPDLVEESEGEVRRQRRRGSSF